jgi:hypothetical protein
LVFAGQGVSSRFWLLKHLGFEAVNDKKVNMRLDCGLRNADGMHKLAAPMNKSG